MVQSKSKQLIEFGDFQTPDTLVAQILTVLSSLGISPHTVIEPSCGRGAFLYAAATIFQDAQLVGADINGGYLQTAFEKLKDHEPRLTLIHENFFVYDWTQCIEETGSPVLIIGNPPWVTSAKLGALGSQNLPVKNNFQNLKGLDALTGKSNFDISEWMLLQNVEWLKKKSGVIAVLCKTAVARKILASVWKRGIKITDARIYLIDALKNFGAAVDACLFILAIDGETTCDQCSVYRNLEELVPTNYIGFVDSTLVKDATLYSRYHSLRGTDKTYKWRSGLKHDCSKVMELTRTDRGLVNGFGETVDIEPTYLYPLIKSSDIAGAKQVSREKLVIVTQRAIGEETQLIENSAPLTWSYLQRYRPMLSGRTSVIYKNKPEFSIFGVGGYTFTPWKIAISGLYKKLVFRLYGNDLGKPIIFDDTVYFLPFESRKEAENVLEMLHSEPALSFLEAMVFWDEKRPITVELLKRLDIPKLAAQLGRTHELSTHRSFATGASPNQMKLFG